MVTTVGKLKAAISLVSDETPVMLLTDGFHYKDYIFVKVGTVMACTDDRLFREGMTKYYRDYVSDGVINPPVISGSKRVAALTIS